MINKTPLRNVSFLIIILMLLSQSGNSQAITRHQESFNVCSAITWQSLSITRNQFDWNCKELFGDRIVELRGSGPDVDTWFISPALNLSDCNEPYLSFDYLIEDRAGNFDVLYSTNFAGNINSQEVLEADWNALAINLFDASQDPNLSNYLRHPAIPLDQACGFEQVYIAFRLKVENSDRFDFHIDKVILTSDYYTEITEAVRNKVRCASFKTLLSERISNHKVIPYTDIEFDVWDSHYTTDIRINDNGDQLIVWDMYSDNPNGQDPYEHILGRDQDPGSDIEVEGSFYNREHSFPKSWWGGTQDAAQFSDIHFVIPADKQVNLIRFNYPYGETDNAVETTRNGSRIGFSNSPDYNDIIFEPIDAYKGDLARMALYVATRYENQIDIWETQNSRGDDALDGVEYTAFEPFYLELLLKWHNDDPVSKKEIDRNNAVFAIQGNRNPFIDHPEYVRLIYGAQDGSSCESQVTTTTQDERLSPSALFPNPTTQSFTIKLPDELSEASLEIFSQAGNIVFKTLVKSNQLLNFHEADGLYFVKIRSDKNKKTYYSKFIKQSGL